MIKIKQNDIDNLSYADIKEVLNKYTLNDLRNISSERQQQIFEMNDHINKEVLQKIDETAEDDDQANYYSKLMYVLCLIINCENAGSKKKNVFKVLKNEFEILKDYGYKYKNEFSYAFEQINKYLGTKIPESQLDIISLQGLYNIKTTNRNIFSFETKFGNFNVLSAEHLQERNFEERTRPNACFGLTTEALNNWKKGRYNDLHGAIFNIPYNFYDTFEHAVLVDIKSNSVIDLVNNIIIPLQMYLKIFGKPDLIVSQEHFNKLDYQFQIDFDEELTIDTLEEVRRIRERNI